VEQHEYVRQVLEAYRSTPGTAGVVRRPDRLFAAQLHGRGVPLETVSNALTLAAARRSVRPADAPPLGAVRSLAYFSPVIDEVLHMKVGPEYFQHLRNRLLRVTASREPALLSKPKKTRQRADDIERTHVLTQQQRTRLRRG
jgi:hypothetical protein